MTREHDVALRLIRLGSCRMSRSVIASAGTATTTHDFLRAAELVVRSAPALTPSLATARRINDLVTPSAAMRSHSPVMEKKTQRFFHWLESNVGRELEREDAQGLAEILHYELAWLKPFSDGNGRTARLMADLVLLRAGRAPAYYHAVEDYLTIGCARAPSTREQKAQYFMDAAERGEELRRASAVISASVRPARHEDAEVTAS